MNIDDLAAAICERQGYTLVGLEGSGAFKVTYHVRRGPESLALKLYRRELSERSDREIDAMRRCDHPNIARLVDLQSIELDGASVYYLVEEYLPGGSLAERVGHLVPRDIVAISRKLCSALSHIAQLDLVHRDLKPDNIMFRDSTVETPVIVDFGLVRDLNAESLTASHMMRGPGTAFFAAPEQLNNDKNLIRWSSDQFGLGVTLAYSLLQRHPHARQGDSPESVVARVAQWEPASSETREELRGRGLTPLVRMLKPFPIQRYPTPELLVAAWEAVDGEGEAE